MGAEARCEQCRAVILNPDVRVAAPALFRVEDDGSRLSVSWRWGRLGSIIGAALAASIAAWSFALWSQLPRLAGAAASIYLGAAVLLNRTRVRVLGRTLRISQGPVPWIRARAFEGSQILRIFAVEEGPTGPQSALLGRRFSVRAELREPRRFVKLVEGLDREDEAVYLEQVLARRLDLRR